MRHGIVEGEPGSMPWGQWWLRNLIRDRLRGKRRDRRSEAEPVPRDSERAEPGRSGSEPAPGENEGNGNGGEGTPTT